ncbi:MAG: hypothetical protein R1F52_07695 [Candidatus Nitrosoabyssus spongiisocia]|nr:MAG: hypothetical protein R1F52_07695 [Nitrosopumilaceae archaeon AB1(1)]
MKCSNDLRLTILEKIGIYSARFSIAEPITYLSTKEVLDAPKKYTQGRRTSAYKYYGVSYLEHNRIFLNIRKIPDMIILEDTIVHELIHLRFPYLSHGKYFNKLVQKGLGGGVFRPRKIKHAKSSIIHV